MHNSLFVQQVKVAEIHYQVLLDMIINKAVGSLLMFLCIAQVHSSAQGTLHRESLKVIGVFLLKITEKIV